MSYLSMAGKGGGLDWRGMVDCIHNHIFDTEFKNKLFYLFEKKFLFKNICFCFFMPGDFYFTNHYSIHMN